MQRNSVCELLKSEIIDFQATAYRRYNNLREKETNFERFDLVESGINKRNGKCAFKVDNSKKLRFNESN